VRPDRVIFDTPIQILVFGCQRHLLGQHLRRRQDQWIA
jgi:hypothetical protein